MLKKCTKWSDTCLQRTFLNVSLGTDHNILDSSWTLQSDNHIIVSFNWITKHGLTRFCYHLSISRSNTTASGPIYNRARAHPSRSPAPALFGFICDQQHRKGNYFANVICHALILGCNLILDCVDTDLLIIHTLVWWCG